MTESDWPAGYLRLQGPLQGGQVYLMKAGMSLKKQPFVWSFVVVMISQVFHFFLTNNGEVEGGLSKPKAVPQLDGVTAAVLLLTTGDGQFTAAVRALNGDVS